MVAERFETVEFALVVEYIAPVPAAIAATASASHDGADAVRWSHAARQMQHQEQQAREAQTQQGALPNGGSEMRSQQLIMKGFDKIEVF